MREAVENILAYCQGMPSQEEFLRERKTLDACIRNFQVLGDAAAGVPSSVQKGFQEIPWRQIKGMRNVLVHEYFGISPAILWNTINQDLPQLKARLDEITLRLDNPSHPWRICPPGEHYVRMASVREHVRAGANIRAHLRREHCRESKGTIKDILTLHETQDIAELFFGDLTGTPAGDDLGFGKKGLLYDNLIRGWTRYWNEVFRPEPPLDPNLVKALLASESGFRQFLGKGKRGAAKGLLQITPITIRALQGARNELKDHIFEFHEADIYDPSLNISAGIRCLFHKRGRASRRLGRQATWEEAVEEYKDYLRRRPKNSKRPHEKMSAFFTYFRRLNTGGRN